MASSPPCLESQSERAPEEAHSNMPDHGVRTRKLTEKGMEFMRSLKEKTYHKALNELKNAVDLIDMQWNDITDTNVLREKRTQLEQCRKGLQAARSEFTALLSGEEMKDTLVESNFSLKQALELRQRIGEMIFELEREELRSISGKSHVSRSSMKSDTSSLRMKAAAELAKKRVECKYAKMETQKKMEIQKRECEMEELQKAKDYERVKAEAEAIAKLEEEDMRFTREMLGQEPVEEKVKEERVNQYLSSLPDYPTPQDTAFQPQHNISEVIAECMQTVRMPLPNLTVFNGNPLDWPLWKSAFEAVIEKRAVTSSEKILYLLQYLSGTPKKVIEGYQYVESPDAYREAKNILEKRFGHPSVVADAFRSKLENWQRIAPKDGAALREFADFLKTCEMAMKSIEDLETLNKQHDNKKLLRVLPNWAHSKWGIKVRKYQIKNGDNKFPPFADFVQFVDEIADVQCLPVLAGLDSTRPVREDKGRISKERFGHRRSPGASSFSTRAREKPLVRKGGKDKACLWCDASHDLDSCQEFMSRPLKERTRHIIRKGLCLRCLEHGHMAKENKCTSVRNCERCNQQHPSCLHKDTSEREDYVEKQVDSAGTNCTSVCNILGQQSGQDQSLIVPVWISNTQEPQNECLTYAILDSQSNATFISEGLRQRLNVQGVESHLLLSTMHKENEMVECRRMKDLQVTDFKRQVTIPLPKVFSRQVIPCKASQIPKSEVALQWEHLKCIAKELMPYREDVEVGLLIGANCPKAIKPREVIPGADDDPYAIRTDLGWGVVGRVCKSPQVIHETDGSWANRTVASELEPNPLAGTNFAFESLAKEVFSPAKVKEMFELDFHERSKDSNSPTLSVEDKRFLKIMEAGIHKREDGHYEMPLPFKSEDVRLPNNRSQALRRLLHLRSRFQRDPGYQKDYVEFMEKMIENCAEPVPPRGAEEEAETDGRINYVAHHGVYHPKKPSKIRVVFDCSALYKGSSLNQNLLQGPDLTNNLVGVLCRFRREPVAFSCDVESMFHQFFINKEDRDLLRFLWWKDSNPKAKPIEYRMKVHLFGAGSSPGCANFAFKKAADDGEAEFGTKAAEFVRRDFYVDDGLTSEKEPIAAVELIKSCQGLCAKAGLRLHKFVSNAKEVIQAIPPEDRAKGLQNIDLKRDPLPIERTLGVVWCVELDCFEFRIVVQDRPTTRRGILSTVSSVYDPLGFVSPLILVGKQILQELCRENADWDDPIPDDLKPRWEQWKKDLHTLEDLKIRRCYKPEEFGELASAEMHHFSDASQKGYGQCSYLRLKDKENRVHCSLIMAKARVTPLKPVTIPRLELTAAVVSVRISQWLRRELHYPGLIEHFWTDSQVVLGYINNNAKRFHVYVANRIQEIHDCTKPDQWHYVRSEINPADAASRGLTAHQLVHELLWLRGPEFLWEPVLSPPEPSPDLRADPNDPEVKKVSSLATQAKETNSDHFETSRLDGFSDWFKTKRAIAACLRLKEQLRKGKPKSQDKNVYHRVSVEEVGQAELEIICCLQHEHFSEEIDTLSRCDVSGEYLDRKDARQRNSDMKRKSSLYRLDPFLDESRILRVGGRLRRANISVVSKHPVILPRKSHITKLIIRHCHDAIKHQGLGMTHNELCQRGYWVIGGVSAVSNYISKCTTCKKLRAPVQQQKMADLPVDRTEPAPPFTYCAVDYFGPFIIKNGRKEVKRYGVLFTCMASRAIHIETANSLETDSFINALRRFLAERGPVRQIRSDRGTNFVGARRELSEALEEMDQDRIHNHLLKESCEWIEFKMNVPSASHMGGVWERQIRSVRNVLEALLEESGTQLDDEGFRTLMKEAQNIVNSRPLTVNDSTSPETPDALTPNHLLMMKTKILMPPPGVFQREDLYSRRRWRRVQHLANQFWSRWKKEFLQTLQARKKWIRPQRNLQIDDIVLVKDENLPRNQWRMARVQEAFQSDDGLVRTVKLAMATTELDKNGKGHREIQYLERPVQKLVVIQPRDREVPPEKP